MLRNFKCLATLFLAFTPAFAASPSTPEPWVPAQTPQSDANGYVAVQGGTFLEGDFGAPEAVGRVLRVEDFDMGVYPVTNAQWAEFVRATKHPAPETWTGDAPLKGQENHPVTCVNRYDVASYVAWLTQRESRVHRLPTKAEFEYAARGGLTRKLYPWGDESPVGRANFDAQGDRDVGHWANYLKPVKTGAANGYGLCDMAGNVWQLVDSVMDPVRAKYLFRISHPADIERIAMGGSWARAATTLRCGFMSSTYPGLRHPDIGFRLVREPARGAPAFHITPRRVVALPQGNGKVYLSWQLLPSDGATTGFNIYRSAQRYAAGERLNGQPLNGGTTFVDEAAPQTGLMYYRVRAIDAAGKEVSSSEWCGVDITDKPSNLVASFVPLPREGSMAPAFGDLDGDGLLDAVLRFGNGHTETSSDPGVPVEIEAYASGGRFIWRKALVSHRHSYGNVNNVPMVVHDLDGDGRAEVACRYEENGAVYLAVLDGMTGEVKHKILWPPLLTDFARSSSRVLMAVAYLDGKTPSIITQSGLYENEVITAFSGQLRKLWEFRSTGPTSGSGSHRIEVVDVDGNGSDEVIIGSTCLNSDGSLRWSIYRQHPDFVIARDFYPERPGRELYYAVETATHAGIYMVEAATGKIIWKHNREEDLAWGHVHNAWAADISPAPGLECFASHDKGAGPALFSTQGNVLADPFPAGSMMPIEWDGQPGRELIHTTKATVSRFDGKTLTIIPANLNVEGLQGHVAMVADLAGDFRDEIVVIGTYRGKAGVHVFTSATPISTREYTRTSDREYRLWLARNLTAGYPTYFEASNPTRPLLK